MTNEKKNKHMTQQDRIEIQECLSKGRTFKALGNRLGKSAYDMFSFYYSSQLASALGISYIPANEVIQSPKLLT